MKTYQINAINSIILIVIGLWGYFGSVHPSVTSFIPVFAGAFMLSLNKGVKEENKIISHIVVTLTLLIFISLIKPLTGTLSRNDNIALLRVLVMMITSFVAMVVYIKSFINARNKK